MRFFWKYIQSIFPEYIAYGLGLPDTIKLKQGKSIAPIALSNSCIVLKVCLRDNRLKHDIEESMITATP